MSARSSIDSLVHAHLSGAIDRRAFVARLTALGLATPLISALADSVTAQTPSPVASPVAAAVGVRPDAGTEGQERGAGGALNLMQWQAPTSLSPHTVTGSKDFLGAQLILEPLMHYDVEARRLPNLITELPSVENGQLAEDMSWVEFHLLPDVVWSDGEPFTADDIAFTCSWVKDPANNAVNQNVFEPIDSVEVLDPLTAKVHFSAPNPFWFDAFTGTNTGYVYPKHWFEATENANETFMSAPIGTGPYKLTSFEPGDSASYEVNENYREANKPFFSTVTIKGGGDPAAAARSVLQTGDFDFAWKLQVEPEVLASMTSGTAGELMPYPGVAVERMNFNFSDPNMEVDGQKSEKNTPHPFWTDAAVRQAVCMAVDRQKIADSFYGNGQEAAGNLLYGDPLVESPNTSWAFDPEGAKKVLDDAGWALNGSVREKDGVQLKATYATSVNSVRQKTQAVIKSNLEAIGFSIELLQIDSTMYFDTAVGNDQNINHFYWDMATWQSVPNSPRPLQAMETFYAGPDGENIAQKSNGWAGQNMTRYYSPEYDAAFEKAESALDPAELAAAFVEMNDILVNNFVILPLVRAGEPRAVSKRINKENIALAPFSGDYWNIANWNLAEGGEVRG